jgi:hypothetical protein
MEMTHIVRIDQRRQGQGRTGKARGEKKGLPLGGTSSLLVGGSIPPGPTFSLLFLGFILMFYVVLVLLLQQTRWEEKEREKMARKRNEDKRIEKKSQETTRREE